jgi:hypothetical protein
MRTLAEEECWRKKMDILISLLTSKTSVLKLPSLYITLHFRTALELVHTKSFLGKSDETYRIFPRHIFGTLS